MSLIRTDNFLKNKIESKYFERSSSEANTSTCSQWWGHILRHFTETRDFKYCVSIWGYHMLVPGFWKGLRKGFWKGLR